MAEGALQGKTALIAGAGRNNGRAIAIEFAHAGANLVLVARSRQKELDEVADECEALGSTTMRVLADVSDPDQVDDLVMRGLDRFGSIEVLVSVAGLRIHRDFWEISNEEWNDVLAVNLSSTFYLARALAPSMMERRQGNIIALGGASSLMAQPSRAHVVASKTALYGLVKSLALELGPYNVRTNLLALQMIENSRLNPEQYAASPAIDEVSDEIEKTPLRRLGTREEVAKVALFLASDQSSYMTGDRVVVAGGRNILLNN